ncbi:MAG: hypothetical protein KDA46_12010 [Parvularculaceae bacterium]|nr:hypothetical protein [Parvularculaceae bacterium]
MSSKIFDSLGGPLQDAVMESAYLAQIQTQAANEAALVKTVGFSDPQMPGTLFADNDRAGGSDPGQPWPLFRQRLIPRPGSAADPRRGAPAFADDEAGRHRTGRNRLRA